MEQPNLDNIELSPIGKFTLLFLPKLGFLPIFSQSVISDLRILGLISIHKKKYYFNGRLRYKLTPFGKMYFRYKRKSFWRFAIPVVISIIALLASYDVLYFEFIHEVLSKSVQLLKTIFESLEISL